ncbi:MAG: GNAT family N-acetyltransferase [Oscillochloris sp.]|nr:GNAT family N-acetyltransferase [Oscillochloris sp.]
MTLRMPVLETERLIIRPFQSTDLDAVYHILDIELADAHTGAEHAENKAQRSGWLDWTIAGYEELARLYQFPMSDRAIVLRERNELIGVVGFNPAIMPFSQVPDLAAAPAGRSSFELGLFWAVSPRQQRRGYAAEAARAMINFAFATQGLWRIVAATSYENAASQAVMRKLGMTLYRNPQEDPPYFQVVGVIEHARLARPGNK